MRLKIGGGDSKFRPRFKKPGLQRESENRVSSRGTHGDKPIKF